MDIIDCYACGVGVTAFKITFICCHCCYYVILHERKDYTTDFTTRGLIQTTRFFSHTSHLTKPNDMGHIASKYGNGMAWPMAQLWVMFWLCRGCCFPYQTHMCHKLHLFVGSIVFYYGTATYLAALHTSPIVSTMIWYGNSPNHSHIVQGYWYLIWECCVPFKLPYNLITRLPGRLTSDMGMA